VQNFSSEDCSDVLLLRRALAGEEPAFLALYERLKTGIFRYAFYMIGSRTAAEEVTQEVFLTLLKEGGNYREDRGEVGAFVFGIARNLVRRVERRERAFEPLPEDDMLENLAGSFAEEQESLAAQAARNQVTERVQAAVASLPDHYRQPVVLCDLSEVSYQEAALRLGCAVGTVRSRLNRAHRLLAQKLQPLKSRQPDIKATGTEGCLI
jgi:RNA polymerase sigma-70 factor, ECF subfamily